MASFEKGLGQNIMRIPKLAQYGLSAYVVVVILAGCGGLAPFPNPEAQVPLGSMRSNSSFGNEVLTAVAKDHCHTGPSGISTHCHFKVSGKATGPYPGHFTAKGRYNGSLCYCPWFFNESFTIRSGMSKISGAIFAKGYGSFVFPLSANYTSSLGNGMADIQWVGPGGTFSETLDGL
jgi:hypothetical protein